MLTVVSEPCDLIDVVSQRINFALTATAILSLIMFPIIAHIDSTQFSFIYHTLIFALLSFTYVTVLLDLARHGKSKNWLPGKHCGDVSQHGASKRDDASGRNFLHLYLKLHTVQ